MLFFAVKDEVTISVQLTMGQKRVLRNIFNIYFDSMVGRSFQFLGRELKMQFGVDTPTGKISSNYSNYLRTQQIIPTCLDAVIVIMGNSNIESENVVVIFCEQKLASDGLSKKIKIFFFEKLTGVNSGVTKICSQREWLWPVKMFELCIELKF